MMEEFDFVQCRNGDEAEEFVKKIGKGFVSSDFRVYRKIDFWDDCGGFEFDASVAGAVRDLQLTLEMLTDGRMEVSLTEISQVAKDLEDEMKKVLAILRFRPEAERSSRASVSPR